MFQTDSDEDVVFVSEKTAPNSSAVTIDQAKLLALQRDIDQESLPRQPAKPVKSQRSAAVEKVKMKSEEDKSERNLKKKEKKHKKEQASLPNSKNYTDDDDGMAEKKEKKKNKVQAVVLEEETAVDEFSSKERKKRKKRVSESLSGDDGDDENNKVSKKKKKKKQLADQVNQDEAATIPVVEKGKKQQKKKEKHKSIEIKAENIKLEKGEGGVEQAGNDDMQKKAKKMKINISAEEQEKTKKKIETVFKTEMSVTKKKGKVAENGRNLEIPEDKIDKGDEVNVKKKKKDKPKEKSEVETPEVKGFGKISKTSAKKTEGKLAKTETVIDDEKIESRKKRKKEKERKASGEVSELEDPAPNKKRKKREEDEALSSKVKEAEEDEQSRECLVSTHTKSKRKKSFTLVEQVDNSVTDDAKRKKKKKKIKVEEVEEPQEPPQMDVVFLSEKSGNADEVTINQERRQALQMEIDEASQPERPVKPSGFGQWSTAQFDSSAQQQKFLRLMGGLKKGFQSAAASGGGANMAMGKQAQQQLQQGLLGEFERAHSRRMDFSRRGAGLGFSAPANNFSIDINACRSVRFDD